MSDAATRLMRSGSHVQVLLDDLVEFSRINLGLGIPVHLAPCDIAELFADKVAQLRAAHPERRIELEVHGSTSGSWDGPYLQRLLRNLVVNALQYGSQGTPVRVIVTGADQDVVIELHNEGAPIEPSVMESLFEALKRGQVLNEADRSRRGASGSACTSLVKSPRLTAANCRGDPVKARRCS